MSREKEDKKKSISKNDAHYKLKLSTIKAIFEHFGCRSNSCLKRQNINCQSNNFGGTLSSLEQTISTTTTAATLTVIFHNSNASFPFLSQSITVALFAIFATTALSCWFKNDLLCKLNVDLMAQCFLFSQPETEESVK